MSGQQLVEDGSRRAAAGARIRAAPGSGGTEEVGRAAAHGLERRQIAVVLAAAGILGPILFTVGWIALLVMFAAFGVLVGPDDAPLHLWAGLAQRVVLAVWFSCTIVLALRLLGDIRAADPQR